MALISSAAPPPEGRTLRKGDVLAVCWGRRIGAALARDGRLVRALALGGDEPRRRRCPLCEIIGCPHESARAARLVGDLLGAGLELERVKFAVVIRPVWLVPGVPAPLLGQIGGLLAGALLGQGVPTVLVSSAEWKSSTKKMVLLRDAMDILDVEERVLVPDEPGTKRPDADALTATAAVTWAAGRWS